METIRWLPHSNINFIIGIDGTLLSLAVSTMSSILIRILVGWSSIEGFKKEYIIAFSIGESFTIAVSRMPDTSLLHVFFESVLIFMSCGAELLIFAGIRPSADRSLVQ